MKKSLNCFSIKNAEVIHFKKNLVIDNVRFILFANATNTALYKDYLHLIQSPKFYPLI